jgi:pSer/pThr/pTyr-binding forkhead associated (FHA) protein
MTLQALLQPTTDGITERLLPSECVDELSGRRGDEAEPLQPGRYIEVQGAERVQTIPLGSDTVHIGRGISADVRLDESSVSRRHAILVPSEGGVRILDDRSSNGTLVNGVRVQQADLSSGDVVTLGRVLLRYIEI